jgi:hypothetical protein
MWRPSSRPTHARLWRVVPTTQPDWPRLVRILQQCLDELSDDDNLVLSGCDRKFAETPGRLPIVTTSVALARGCREAVGRLMFGDYPYFGRSTLTTDTVLPVPTLLARIRRYRPMSGSGHRQTRILRPCRSDATAQRESIHTQHRNPP